MRRVFGLCDGRATRTTGMGRDVVRAVEANSVEEEAAEVVDEVSPSGASVSSSGRSPCW